MNSFNKTEAAFCPMRAMLHKSFQFFPVDHFRHTFHVIMHLYAASRNTKHHNNNMLLKAIIITDRFRKERFDSLMQETLVLVKEIVIQYLYYLKATHPIYGY